MDERFKQFSSDPRFSKSRKGKHKLKVDSRFSHAKHEADDFSAPIDKYGRKKDTSIDDKRLGQLYQFTEDLPSGQKEIDSSKKYDPARGEGTIDTSEDESDLEDALSDEDIEKRDLIVPIEETPYSESSYTSRFAIVNFDWDNVSATDLFVAVSSFLPATGKVKSVTVYPSEFGLQRLKKDQLEGPPSEIFADTKKVDVLSDDQDFSSDSEEESNEDKIRKYKERIKKSVMEEDTFNMEKLRQYQLERIRYYYAVVECDSIETAKHIYHACDGTEYEASANFFDLRFISDETQFEAMPRESCNSMPTKYKPPEFTTDVLQHSNVKLTWDQPNPKRAEAIRRAFTEGNLSSDDDLKEYIASSSDEDEMDQSTKDATREAYAKLLDHQASVFDNPNKAKKDINMEVTFSGPLKEGDELDANKEETAIEKYKRKEAERKRKRKEAIRATQEQDSVDLGFDDPFFTSGSSSQGNKTLKKNHLNVSEKIDNITESESDDEKHFNMKNILKSETSKTKRTKRGKFNTPMEGLQADVQLDVKDPRFNALYNSHHFAIDPTDPHYIPSKTMKNILDTAKNSKPRQDKSTLSKKDKLKNEKPIDLARKLRHTIENQN